MSLILRLIATAFLSVLVIIPQAAETERNRPAKTITVCHIEFTGLGKAATWHFNYTYSVDTDQNGSVDKITKLHDSKGAEMTREDKIMECIKTWKLGPSNKYFVLFSVGTTSATNYISISESKGETIRLILRELSASRLDFYHK